MFLRLDQGEYRGWYSVKGAKWCSTDNNWNTYAPSSGKGSAHCCKPVPVPEATSPIKEKGITKEEQDALIAVALLDNESKGLTQKYSIILKFLIIFH